MASSFDVKAVPSMVELANRTDIDKLDNAGMLALLTKMQEELVKTKVDFKAAVVTPVALDFGVIKSVVKRVQQFNSSRDDFGHWVSVVEKHIAWEKCGDAEAIEVLEATLHAAGVDMLRARRQSALPMTCLTSSRRCTNDSATRKTPTPPETLWLGDVRAAARNLRPILMP
jgi:hypothetical protein